MRMLVHCAAQGGGCLHCWAWRIHDMELGNVMSSSVWESKTKCHHHQVIDKRNYTSTCACIDGVLCLLSLDTLNRWCSHHPFAHGKQPKASTKQSLHSLLTTMMVGLEVLERKQSSKAGSTNTPAAKLAAKAFYMRGSGCPGDCRQTITKYKKYKKSPSVKR